MRSNFTLACSILLAFITADTFAQQLKALNFSWHPREDLNVMLPANTRIFETNGLFPDGSPVRAMYAHINLEDPNLELRVTGDPKERLTTLESYTKEEALIAINGGYYFTAVSLSLIVSDGKMLASGPKKLRGSYPTRGAFGIIYDMPRIDWVYSVGKKQKLFSYPEPNKINAPKPTAQSPAGARRWPATQAVGGGPILVKRGKIVVEKASRRELFEGPHLGKHPRTAIGILPDKTMILLVVDGRQEASSGATMQELAQMMSELGCLQALNLDGGGSSTLVAADEVVNVPSAVTPSDRNQLRENASALVISEKVPTMKPSVYLYDTDAPGYQEQGGWQQNSTVNDYGNTHARSILANTPDAKAVYTFKDIPYALYQVSGWWPVNNESNSSKVPLVIHHEAGIDTIYVDQKASHTMGRWNILGKFHLRPNDKLEIIAKGEGNTVLADAIRLVQLSPSTPTSSKGDIKVRKQFQVYPNPAGNLLYIESEATAIQSVTIISSDGRVVKTVPYKGHASSTLDISSLASGLYLLQIHTRYGNYTQRFVKQ